MSRWKLVAFVGAFAWSVAVTAQVVPQVPQVPQPPRVATGLVDGRFDGLRNVLEKYGPESNFFGPNGLQSGRVDGIAGLLWFDEALSAEQLAKLEAAGVEWTRNARGVARVGSVYSAFVRFEALDALRAAPGLIVAEVAWRPLVVRPLDVTTAEIGAAAARNMPNMEATGAGVVIGDIDSGIDVLHPHFFHADAGAYRWLDTNGDGVFTPGVDHVDLNGDGEGDSNELARVLDGANVTSDQQVSNNDGVLDVALDWIYVDANSDGERNAGPGAFFEDTPGYGEPIFVPDDANGDGVLGLDERLLRLGTSKVLRFTTNERIFVRGVDMIEAANFPNLDYAMHGTGVASILLGGHSGRARAGLAPDADLVMYTGSPETAGSSARYADAFAALEDAVAHGVDMVVHEWTDPTLALLDGGGPFEEAMRVAREAGVVQVNPLGNLNWSQKHIEVDAPAGVTALDFIVGSDYYGAPYSVVYVSLNASSPTFPTQVELVDPLGNRSVVRMDGGTDWIGGAALWGALTQSPRGTRQLLLSVWNTDNTSIPQGTWRLNVELDAATRIVGRVADYYSGWDVAVRWQNPVVDRGTVVFPATADAAFGVAAYGGRHVMDYDGNTGVGQLRNFSGRGPRIDGARVVDLAAPDDPFAALVAGPGYISAGYGRTWFTTFGGTSGAGPHVAGTVALMRSQQPDLTPDAIEARLLATARTDTHTPVPLPNAAWGSGKLDTYAAVYGVSADLANRNPVAVLQRAGEVVSAEASSDPDGDALLARWDVDYDGTWDTDWTTELTIPAVAGATVRLELRDGRGGRAGAVLVVDDASVIEGPMEHAPDAGGHDAGGEELIVHDLLGDRPCGCASTGEASGSALLFALLFAGGWTRRHVRRRT